MDTLIFLIVLTVAVILYSVFMYFRQKKILKTLSEEEFKAGYRKAQLIDVREPNEFANGHILGARNIPLTQLKARLKEVRPDKPVYLYCQSGSRSGRAAQLLHKKGYKDLSHLEGGFKKWGGKIKAK
ncbi:rhodanese-like domain-containing protein [Mesobacillus sp. AQ2]|uniref:rhodanese-like domain-containing protein n=1 Tax=Bacillaceae TaxID=186817 RepID=UPI0011A66D3E|nr:MULTISPECIES: rhodanese-like domain-containing protein [Bacillaceae]MCM3122374.1 rhodanese-like domain-containing protein [Mesobacillus sp. MER 33]MCM3232338.1 rhodanese-like domain-containing protein [Mesobacillus sp. MER 48]WHX39280.1 rhodanese-like domain-containing protein [Mesobacillus sp. AQ2]